MSRGFPPLDADVVACIFIFVLEGFTIGKRDFRAFKQYFDILVGLTLFLNCFHDVFISQNWLCAVNDCLIPAGVNCSKQEITIDRVFDFQKERQLFEPRDDLLSLLVFQRVLFQKCFMLAGVFFTVRTQWISCFRVQCVIADRIEFVVSHNGESMTLVHHVANNFNNSTMLAASVNKVTQKNNFGIVMLINTAGFFITKMQQQFFEFISLSVNVSNNVIVTHYFTHLVQYSFPFIVDSWSIMKPGRMRSSQYTNISLRCLREDRIITSLSEIIIVAQHHHRLR